MTIRFKREPDAYKKQRQEGENGSPDGVILNGMSSKEGDQNSSQSAIAQAIANNEQPSNFAPSSQKAHASRWKLNSLKTKATGLAIALSILPVMALGAITYKLTEKNMAERLTQQQQARAISLGNQLDQFMLERYKGIKTLSNLSIFNNRRVRTATSDRTKAATLAQYLEDNPGYDSITVLDLDGNVIYSSPGATLSNYRNIDYFQEVIKTNRPVITPPRKSLATGEVAMFAAAPVVDTLTGKTIAVVRSRTPVKYLNQMLHAEAKQLAQNIKPLADEEYLAVNEAGKIFVAPPQHPEYVGRTFQSVFPKAAISQASEGVGTAVDIDRIEQQEYQLSYAPLRELRRLTGLRWTAIVSQPTSEMFAERRGLLLNFWLGTGLTMLAVCAIALFLVNRALRRVMDVSQTVRKLGQGQLDSRVSVKGQDEIATLGSNINLMADQLQTLIRKQQAEAEQVQLFNDTTLRIRRSLNLEDILGTAVKEVRRVLHAERVVIYRFNSDLSGTVVAESVAPGWTKALNEKLDDPCFRERYIKEYEDGRVRAIDNIYQAGLADCHIATLERFEVKANLVAPILTDNQLFGLLIAHQCSEPRAWQQSEIDLFTQIAFQIGIAIDQAHLLKELQRSEVVLRLRDRALAATSNGIIITDSNQEDNPIIFSNPAFEKMTGYSSTEVIGHSYNFLQGPETSPATIEEIHQAVEAQRECQVVIENYRKDGTMFWNELTVSPVRDAIGRVTHFIWVHTDVTNHKLAEEELRHSEELQRKQKETLELQLVELLTVIEGASSGDLTVRADVTASEIGTVADFFNAIVESLRQIVTQVKQAAGQVNVSVGENEIAIRQLAKQALIQADKINRTLDSVEHMTVSIQDVATSARQAAEVASTASTTAEAGEAVIDRTVQSITNLRNTVAETAIKVKRLGDSSQQISKVVALINQIALQTNVLAINASIEAARAGEEGRGFAVVAEEVSQLAAKSTTATKEIEQIVDNIQRETNEVVRSMELGTTQVVEGTLLVEGTKRSLGQMLDVSRRINDLVQSISSTTVSQAQTAQAVTHLMKEVATVSEHTASSSKQVSGSLQQTVEIAQQLQVSVDKFKVDDENLHS